jgi:hypothetical protein
VSDYPTDLKVQPLTTWPGQLTRQRRRAGFAAALRDTLLVLKRELNHMQATNPIMEVAIPADQFRLDGRPRVAAKSEHPGVVLSLPKTRVGPLRYAADEFLTWQDNLRAIAMGMEALRKVERYGIVRNHEQYTGFRALTGGEGDPERWTSAEAIRHLQDAAGIKSHDPEKLYREAVKHHHPDRGGDPAAFALITSAIQFLRGAA